MLVNGRSPVHGMYTLCNFVIAHCDTVPLIHMAWCQAQGASATLHSLATRERAWS